MKIVFDMDNTLTDEVGSSVRPGVVAFLRRLKSDGYTLCLWTNSTRARALSILREHNLTHFFSTKIFREDYDPNNRGLQKDIRKIGGDVLIDDDPNEVEYVRSIGGRAFELSPFRMRGNSESNELDRLYEQIAQSRGLFHRMFHR